MGRRRCCCTCCASGNDAILFDDDFSSVLPGWFTASTVTYQDGAVVINAGTNYRRRACGGNTHAENWYSYFEVTAVSVQFSTGGGPFDFRISFGSCDIGLYGYHNRYKGQILLHGSGASETLYSAPAPGDVLGIKLENDGSTGRTKATLYINGTTVVTGTVSASAACLELWAILESIDKCTVGFDDYHYESS